MGLESLAGDPNSYMNSVVTGQVVAAAEGRRREARIERDAARVVGIWSKWELSHFVAVVAPSHQMRSGLVARRRHWGLYVRDVRPVAFSGLEELGLWLQIVEMHELSLDVATRRASRGEFR